MSARYQISNRNIYGFRTNMYQMMFLLIPLLIALSLLAEFVLGPVLYGFYQKDATLEEGAAQVLALVEAGQRLKDAVREVAEHTGLSKNGLYATALEMRD